MLYAALDVSLRSMAVCIIDQDGKICFERSARSDVPDLVRCLQAFGQPIHQVGFEAGALTQPITYGLVEAGYDVVCMEARQVAAALSAMRNKTDKHDARHRPDPAIRLVQPRSRQERRQPPNAGAADVQGDAAQVHRPGE